MNRSRRKLFKLANGVVKQSGYVRGYFPELASHVGEWVSPSAKDVASGAGNHWGKLALLAALLGGGYYLYNKYKDKKTAEEKEDAENYDKMPRSVVAGPPVGRYDNYVWADDDDDSDYEYDTYDDDEYYDDEPDLNFVKRNSYKLFNAAAARVLKVKDYLRK